MKDTARVLSRHCGGPGAQEIFSGAENRLHAQKAVLCLLMQDG